MRPINKIAAAILADWGPTLKSNGESFRAVKAYKIYAMPYVQAMLSLTKTTDMYGVDDGEDIVLRFLTNAASWRGDTARAIKAELNLHLEHHRNADH